MSSLPEWGSKRPVAERTSDSERLSADVRERLERLHELALFRGISAEELVPLAEASQTVHFEPDQHVVRQGDPGDSIYVITQGGSRCWRRWSGTASPPRARWRP